ncbi:YccF domain-containing protein [Radicibacter daui]|uniref:YccF domain-containing protein n=1 Tax=Radicibacter daui TaxID=3064829 RepID=UPI004046F875
MATINLALNLLWFVLLGFAMALGWLVAGVLLALTIIGLPWSIACFRIAAFAAWPFGRVVVKTEELTGDLLDANPMAGLGNIVWFVLAGWWLALGHVLAAVGYAVTIIGLPFAWQHLKLAQLALLPLGRQVVDADLAEAAYDRNRMEALSRMRRRF